MRAPRCMVWRVLVAAVVFSSTAEWSAFAAERNIIVFITDDESPTLGCYGDPVAVTPAIDALAADGMVFDNAFATSVLQRPMDFGADVVAYSATKLMDGQGRVLGVEHEGLLEGKAQGFKPGFEPRGLRLGS